MRTVFVVVLFSLMVVALQLAGAAAPGAANWGVHHYGFLPRLWLAVGGAGAILIFLLAWLRGTRTTAAGGVLVAVMTVLAGAVVFWLARERAHFLGNGGFWIEGIVKGAPDWRLQPAAVGVVLGLHRLTGSADPAAVLAWTSVAAGVVTLLSVFFFARAVTEDAWEQAVVFGVVVLAGTTRLFTGYVEVMPLVAAGTVLYLACAARYLAGRAGPWGAVATATVVPWLHPAGVLLLPSLAYLLWTGPDGHEEQSDRTRRNGRLLALFVPLAAVAVEIWVLARSGGGSVSWRYALATFLPLSPGGESGSAPALFGAVHLRDLFQEQMILGPFGALFVLVLLLFRAGGGLGRVGRFLLWAGVPWWVLSLLFDHSLGASRDWARFAPATMPFLFLAAVLLARLPRRLARPRLVGATVGLVLGVSLFHLLPWVGMGTSPDRSLAQFAVLYGPRSPASAFACSYAFEEIGAWQLDRNRPDEAMAALREAVAVDSTNLRAARNLFSLLLIQGKTKEAAETLRSVAKRAPGGETLYLDLGNAFLAAKKPDDAVRAFRDALAVNPATLAAYDGLLRAEQAKGDLEGARKILEEAKERFPEDARIRANLGSVLTSLGKPNEAVAEYRRALELNPQDATSAYDLSLLLLAQRQYEEARDRLSRVVELEPENAEAWSNLGVAQEMLGDRAAAAEAFGRAVNLNPSRPEPTFNLARVSLALGDTARAVAALQAWGRRDSTSHWAEMSRTLLQNLGARAP